MRSSIACTRCRKSKIRCDNAGVNTTCAACTTAGRECTYPTPSGGQTSTPKRSEPTNGSRIDFEVDFKRARNRQTEASRKQSVREDGVNPLESPPISLPLWREIYNTFHLNFSTELSFVHESTLFKWAAQSSQDRSPQVEDFLLGILALTARFIPDLVKHHTGNSRGQRPYGASEFYATALISRLNAESLCKPSVERCQALLMLGLFSWGQCRGVQAWTFTGNALSMAEILGLFIEAEPIDATPKRSPTLTNEDREREAMKLGVRSKSYAAQQLSKEDQLRDREMRRRTMYSIFILDKYLASGKNRRQRIKYDELRVQLPCSDRDFRFGNDVKTGYLTENGIKLLGNNSLDDTHILSIYIRLVEIWGKLSAWACNGGRREEKFPPWDKRSHFFQLRKDLDDFKSSLPSNLTYSASKLEAHIDTKTSTAYTAIHCLYSLCRIVLHREHIPFLPVRCEKPTGPLDAPTFPPERYHVPEGFWEESAEHIFRSAKEILDIVRSCALRGCLVESAQVGFAIWQAGFVGVYSIAFPFMDTGKYMCDSPSGEAFDIDAKQWSGMTGLAIKTLREISLNTAMANGWCKYIRRMFTYFHDIKRDYLAATTSNDNHLAAAALRSLRDGGAGGGLEEYKLAERELKDWGTLEDDERYTPEDNISNPRNSAPRLLSPSSAAHFKQEPSTQSLEANPGSTGAWAAVNNSGAYPNSTSYEDGRRTGTSAIDYATQQAASGIAHLAQSGGQYNSYYQPHLRGSTSNSQSLTSPPNTNSTPSTAIGDSPYNINQNPSELTPATSNGYYRTANGYGSGAAQQPYHFAQEHIRLAEMSAWNPDLRAWASGEALGPPSDYAGLSGYGPNAGGDLNPGVLAYGGYPDSGTSFIDAVNYRPRNESGSFI